MKYLDGNSAFIGDVIQISNSDTGVVVCSVDDSEYSDEYSKEDWEYLGVGILVNTSFGGLVHYTKNTELVCLLKRNSNF